MPSYIDGHIKYFAGDHPHQFPLRLLNLIMQAAQDALAGFGMIILHELERDTGLRKVSLLVTFKKKAPLVLEYFWLDQQDVGERSRDKFQLNILTWNFVYEDN